MHLVILTVGTRGDAQPYVAVGRALRRLGHAVTVATHEDHRALVESNGLGFRPILGSFRELLASPAGARWLASSDSPAEYVRSFRALFEPFFVPWAEEQFAAVEDADGALVHWFAVPTMQALELRKTPWMVVSPYATIASREIPLLGMPRIPLLTGWVNRTASRYFQNKVWDVMAKELIRFREERGLPKLKSTLWAEIIERGVGHLHMFSDSVVPRPSDWPECAEVTGYCFLDAPEGWTPRAALVDFLAAGPPPLYVGFGSMTGMDPEKLAAITREALRANKQRAVIGMGWGGMASFAAADDVIIVDDVPHDWLFPRVSAVVHHGGAGTVAAALRAGKPSVVVPFFADQPVWARTLRRLGACPPVVLKRQLTGARLAAAIAQVLADPSYARRAAELGEKIRREDGAARTAERALHYLGRAA